MGAGLAVGLVALVLPVLLTLGASRYRRLRFELRIVVSVLLGLGLLIVYAILLVTTQPSEDPTAAWVATAATFFVTCSVQALFLGYIAGWGAVRWILGTIAVTALAFVAGAMAIVAGGTEATFEPGTRADFLKALTPGLSALMVITGVAGTTLAVLWRAGWARDSGEFPWDQRRARNTVLGRKYMPPEDPPR